MYVAEICRFKAAISHNVLLLITGVDLFLYAGVTFQGMKLAGIVLIAFGFIVVLLPSNWTDMVKELIR